MALYPEVQKKAQEEIDSVIGPNRLPNFEDRPSLPYINAVVKESMRWHVPAPLGEFFIVVGVLCIPFWRIDSEAVPHMATNDDEYNGYYIPKGTVVLGNAWSVRTSLILSVVDLFFLFRSILHDPELFNNPMEYQPERYLKDGLLKPDYLDINSVVFGFGRRLVLHVFLLRCINISWIIIFLYRVCPGRHLADNLLFSIVSCLLAVYDIKPPVDNMGNPIKLEADFTSEFLS